jgi:hypothetical protein
VLRSSLVTIAGRMRGRSLRALICCPPPCGLYAARLPSG